VQKVKFPSSGGAQIEAFIFTPPGYKAGAPALPTLLRIHGGPLSQYSWHFNFESQLFARQRYAGDQREPARLVGIRRGVLQGDLRRLGQQGITTT